MLSRVGLLPFESSAFRWLWGSSLLSAATSGMERTATAWLALQSGGGALGVGLVLAARMLPSLLFGLASGTLADRADRSRLLASVGIAAAPVLLGFSWLFSQPGVELAYVLVFAFLFGCVSVFDAPARQVLAVDALPPELAANGLALNALAQRLSIAIGAVGAGLLIPSFGIATCYLVVAIGLVGSSTLVTRVRPRYRKEVGIARTSFGRGLIDAARLILDIPAVSTLMVTGVTCEVFAFSYSSATPVFVRDVLGEGAEALGTLNAAASIGGTVAVLVLSAIPGWVRREPVLGAAFLGFGASLMALAATRSLWTAASVLILTGSCSALVDVLQQTLLQMAVPQPLRARAVGLWVLGLGSGPIGFVEMGIVVAVLGAPSGLLINGLVVVLAAVSIVILSPSVWLSITRDPVSR